VIKVLAWIGAVLAAVVVATGVYGAFRYRPEASGLTLVVQRLHAVSAVVLAVVTVVGGAALVWERRPDRRHGLPAFAVIGVVALLLAAAVWSGWRIAWDQLALWAVTPPAATGGGTRGVFLHGVPVKVVLVDGVEVGATAFRRTVWAHVVVLPVLVGVGIAFVVVWTRRFARPEARPPRDDG